MNFPSISSFYKEISDIIVIPPNSLAQKFKKYLKLNTQIRIKSAPIILDAITPDYFENAKNKIVLLDSFIGHTPVLYLIELLSDYSLKNIFFIGSCSKIIDEHNLKDAEDENKIFYPDTFLLETNTNASSKIFSFNNNYWSKDSNKSCICTSLSLPTFMSIEKISILHKKHAVMFADMEAAFIAESCDKKGINYHASLVCTDHTFLNKSLSLDLKKASQVADFNSLFQKIELAI